MNLTALASLRLVAFGVISTACGGAGGSSSSAAGLMVPGQDCVRCHSFTVAGTVFDAPDGGAQGVEVVVGRITLTSNAAGNFYTATSVSFPATVEMRRGVVAARMTSPAPDGRCNGCHDGVSQPRLAAP